MCEIDNKDFNITTEIKHDEINVRKSDRMPFTSLQTALMMWH
jgi:hypothetical protein